MRRSFLLLLLFSIPACAPQISESDLEGIRNDSIDQNTTRFNGSFFIDGRVKSGSESKKESIAVAFTIKDIKWSGANGTQGTAVWTASLDEKVIDGKQFVSDKDPVPLWIIGHPPNVRFVKQNDPLQNQISIQVYGGKISQIRYYGYEGRLGGGSTQFGYGAVTTGQTAVTTGQTAVTNPQGPSTNPVSQEQGEPSETTQMSPKGNAFDAGIRPPSTEGGPAESLFQK